MTIENKAEQLAHHLASELADTIEGITCGDELHRYLLPDKAIPLLTQAFAAIRKQVRDEALEEAIDARPKTNGRFSDNTRSQEDIDYDNAWLLGVCDYQKLIRNLKDSK